MKILTVRFQNLNSLQGEWQIDFTHPAYQNNSIFAITGPTGSGKTTLLDAVCLALYGRTPRLKTISKSSNEILTRQTGFCYAEITFETLKGSYRCHWSQHRARKNQKGDLQQPRHEIVDTGSNRILENKIRDVARVVEEVTGMNFDQFTRSILLAQGRFAEFLLAQSDERSPILEQITGTEIYSRISRKVHERTAGEEKAYRAMADELANIAILSQEEAGALQQRMTEEADQARLLQSQLAGIHTSLSRHDMLLNLGKDIDRLQEQSAISAQLLKDEEENRAHLARANAAAAIQPQYRNLISLRSLQHKEQEDCSLKENVLLSLRQQLEVLTGKREEAQQGLGAAEKQLQQEKLTATLVRGMDIRLEEAGSRLLELNRASEQNQQRRTEHQDILASIETRRQLQHNSLKETRDYLHLHQLDQELLANLAVLSDIFSQLHSQSQKRHSLAESLEKTRTHYQHKSEQTSTCREKCSLSQKAHSDIKAQLGKAVDNLAQLDRHHPGLRNSLEATAATIHLLEKLQSLVDFRRSLEEERQRQTQILVGLQVSLETAGHEERYTGERLLLQQESLRKQEEIVLLASRLSSFEEERARLQAGSPCPLCGATDHPFAATAPDGVDEARQLLQVEKQHFAELQEQLSAIRTAKTLALSRQEETAGTLVKLNRQLEENSEAMAVLTASLNTARPGFVADTGLLIMDGLVVKLEDCRREHQLQKELAADKDRLEATVAGLQKEHARLLELHTSNERQLQQADFEQKSLAEKITELEFQHKEKDHEISLLLADFSTRVAPYGFSDCTQHNSPYIIEQLTLRQDNWKKQSKNEQSFAEGLLKTEAEAKKHTALLEKLTEDLQQLTRESQIKKEEIDRLTEDRRRLYGDKDPDQQEQRLQRNLAQAAEKIKMIEQEHGTLTNKLAVVTEQVRALTEAIAARREVLLGEENQFAAALLAGNFADELEFIGVQLPAEQRMAMESRLKNLEEQWQTQQTLLAEKRKQLQMEEDKKITTESREELAIQLAATTQALGERQQEVGRIQGRLQENSEHLQKQQQQRAALADRRKELLRWQNLDSLIGSANGNVFRNFAQGITFEIMVRHANSNLAKMSDRYILVRDNLRPLELNVIDNYRAGDVRTTLNLSGGESFLVSLALALGLSNMASKNVRVDSLFLDEGFGTLDEETLETALQTLAGLQQEGKIIGIISHIPLLQERLDTHIRIIAGRAGHSRISGPGVSAL